MRVWFLVKMCFWDRQFIYLVRNDLSSSSFVFNTYSVLIFSNTFSKEAVIPTRSPRSEFAVTLVASRPEDAFIDLTANSIVGAVLLLNAVKIAFWILLSTVLTLLPIYLSILSLKHPSKVGTITNSNWLSNSCEYY